MKVHSPRLTLTLLFAAGSLFSSVRAQNIYMRDGEAVLAEGLRRDGANVIALIQTREGSKGELGYAVANISRIDFPEPPQLKIARDLLDAGNAEEAARQLTPILAYYAPFRDIPGNWWTPLALLQVDALARLGRARDVDNLLSDIARYGGTDANLQREVRIKQAVQTERLGEHKKALAELEPITSDLSIPPSSLSEAWLAQGSAQLGLRDYKDAQLAFLHVLVYTPDRKLLMAPALLGSAGALVGLDDGQRARDALREVVSAYPNTPEAAQAKERLKTLALPTPKPSGG